MKKLMISIFAAILLCGVVLAQDVFVQRGKVAHLEAAPGPEMRVMQFIGEGPGPGAIQIIAAGEGMVTKVVKNAPYSGELVTENVQKLADGTTITRSNKTVLYRDSEGRTRRETTLERVGPFAAGGPPTTTISLHDPVAREMILLEPQTKTARRIKLPEPASMAGGGNMHWVHAEVSDSKPGVREERRFEIRVAGPGEGGPVPHKVSSGPNHKSEPLGSKTIEGLVAEGTRVTMTVPEGAIGNDRPLVTVTETWYSPELQTVVYRKSADPRTGESTTRLTNVSRAEPPSTLFQVPPDYQIKDRAEVESLDLKGPAAKN